MVLTLADRLDLPLREKNRLLLAAGYAPRFSERALEDPELAAAREAIDLVLKAQEPNPALAVDGRWQVVATNAACARLFAGIAPHLLERPNAVRISLHPDGLAPRIDNLAEWRAHTFERLERQAAASGDAAILDLLAEVRNYPGPTAPRAAAHSGVLLPMRLRTQAGLVSLFGTVTMFGTPQDVTLSEIAIESFFPADAESAALLRTLAG
jgi:hypothetical protein